MKRYIYLLRHGNPGRPGDLRRCLGRTDVSVSDYGRRQIEKSKEYTHGFDWTKVYSSPMKRCLQTADCLGIDRDQILVRENLREMDGGIWDNMTFADIKEKYPALYEERGKSLGTFAVEGAESFKEAGERFYLSMQEIRKETEENLLIIAHAGVIRAFLCAVTGKNYDEVMHFSVPYGSVTILEEEDGQLKLLETGLRSCKLVDDEEIKRIYQACKTPEPVIAHMEMTAKFIDDIMNELERYGLVGAGERELVNKAALLHDICRTEKNHAVKSAAYLRKEGYKDIADLVMVHHDSQREPKDRLLLHEILFYADKRVCEDQIVSIEERFGKSMDKCRGIPEALAKHRALYVKSREIQEKLKIRVSESVLHVEH